MQHMKVFVLMAGLTALMVTFGGYFGGQSGAILVFILAAVMNFGMYWFSDRVVLRMYKARVIGPEEAPDLYNLAAMVVQFAISRQNEYQADATGGRIAGDPLALASALENLERSAKRIPMKVNPAGAHLAIVNPLASIRGGGVMGLFRTHPPTEERVSRLREQASQGDF